MCFEQPDDSMVVEKLLCQALGAKGSGNEMLGWT
jgi:hypothetical protein